MNKKYIFIGGGVLVVAIIGFIIMAILNLGSLIKLAVEEVGPKLTQSEVKLDSADISFLSGSGELDGLLVGNPKGYSAPNAIKVGNIRMTVDKGSLTTDRIIIREIVILAPEITYEKKGKTDNFKALIANVNKAVASEKKQEKSNDSGSKEEAGSQKKVQIDNLIIKNGKVNLAGGLLKTFGDKGMGINLPDIHLKDIGKKKDTTPAQAFALVLNEMTKGIGSSVGNVAKTLQDTLKKGLESGGGAVDNVTKGIKGLFGGDE
jgi:hypothetical protein